MTVQSLNRRALLAAVLRAVRQCVAVSAAAAFAAAFLAVSAPAHGAGLNDTGQTNCYNAAGGVVSCTAAGVADDGRYGRDAAAAAGVLTKTGAGAAGFDFTKIANDGSTLAAGVALGSGTTDWACTLDNTTGLLWEVKLPGSGFRGANETFSWYSSDNTTNGGDPGQNNLGTCSTGGPNGANQCDTEKFVANVNAANLCGYSNWRMPSVTELVSIGNAGALSPFVDVNYFPNTAAGTRGYWSGTSDASIPSPTLSAPGAWAVVGTNANGVVKWPPPPFPPTDPMDNYVRLVRGGSPLSTAGCAAPNPKANVVVHTPTSDFVDHGDGTVTHTKTGLMWKRCPEGQTLEGSTCTGSQSEVAWSSALAIAEASTFADHTNWRVPNIKELYSIVEFCGHNLALNYTVFPYSGTANPVFWSATSVPFLLSDKYGVQFLTGETQIWSPAQVRLVRDGQPEDSFDRQNPDPDQFTFVDQGGVSLNTIITSAPVQITGIDPATNWSVTGGVGEVCVSSGNDCSCNVASYGSSGTIANNQYICARHTSSGSFSTAVDTEVTVGDKLDTFTSTTLAADTTPGGFTFIDQTNVPLSTLITSAPVQISGINTTTPWSVSAGVGQACVSSGNNCSCDVAGYGASGTVANNQYLCARHTSSANYSTAVNTTVTVGGVSDTFTSTTVPPTLPPGPEVSLSVNGGTGDEVFTTNPVAVTYRLHGCQGQELFLVLNAPAMGIVWSYLNASGHWVPLPANLADITPFNTSGPADGSYPLFTGSVPLGDYELYLGCDFVKNGHLDYMGGAVNGVYGHSIVHVR